MTAGAPGSLQGPLVQRVLQRVLVALWVGVIPVLLAALVWRFLVPPGGPGFYGILGSLGHRLPIPMGIALFFLFSGLARYWRFRVPGGRYASALPAHLVPGEHDADRLATWAADAGLYELAIAPAMRRRMAARLDAPALDATDAALADLREALATGDAARARAAADAVALHARPALDARRRRDALATVGAVAVAAAAALGLRAGVAESYDVLSASMLPTFEPGDRVLGNKRSYAGGSSLPHRGDVVVFRSSAVALPAGIDAPDILVKRVIGLPGDRVAMRGGQPVINGWAVPVCDAGEYVFLQADERGGSIHGRLRVEFLDDRAYLTVHAMAPSFREPYEVKPGEVFVLGDNRGNSLDSRAWNAGRGGGVPLRGIDGRAQWFLVGGHRGGDADFGRLGRGVDGLESRLHLEGLNTQAMRDGIAKCLTNRPAETRPPPPVEASGARASEAP